MQIRKFRPLVQLIFFIVLIYGAFFGLRFSNFMPGLICKAPFHYSSQCFLLPHNLQYGLSAISQSPTAPRFIALVPPSNYGYVWFGGTLGVTITMYLTLVVMIVFFNTLWCGWACPFGALQDGLSRLRSVLRISRLRLTDTVKKVLGYVKMVCVVLFVSTPIACLLGLAAQRPFFCSICPAKGIMSVLEGNVGAFFISPQAITNIFSTIFAGITLSLMFLCNRFFCFICPVVGCVSVFGKFSVLQIRKDSDLCKACARCADACLKDLKEISFKNKAMEPIKDKCIHCYECVETCPEGALSIHFFKWKIYFSKRKWNKK